MSGTGGMACQNLPQTTYGGEISISIGDSNLGTWLHIVLFRGAYDVIVYLLLGSAFWTFWSRSWTDMKSIRMINV